MAKKQGISRSMRVTEMCNSFIDLHKEGKSIAQIAKTFGISVTSVYKHLDEIAEKNHTTREFLLERNSSPHSTTHKREPYEKVSIEKLMNELDQTIAHTRNLLSEVEKLMEEFNYDDFES